MPHKVQTICNERHYGLCIQLAKTFDELAKLNYPAKKTEQNLEMQRDWSADGIKLMKEVYYGNKHDVDLTRFNMTCSLNTEKQTRSLPDRLQNAR